MAAFNAARYHVFVELRNLRTIMQQQDNEDPQPGIRWESARNAMRGFRAMLCFYSRLPGGVHEPPDFRHSCWLVPLVGATIGSLGAIIGLLAYLAGISLPLVALISIASLLIATGAFHEDGLADTADGFWGGFTPERRLEIMRDSRIGTYGGAALVLSIALRVGALGELLRLSGPYSLLLLPGIGAVSRPAALIPALRLPLARAGGLAGESLMPGARHLAFSIAIGIAMLAGAVHLLDLAIGFFVALLCTGVIVALATRIARAKISGYTGDVLGATQQLAEIVLLLVLSAAANWRGPI